MKRQIPAAILFALMALQPACVFAQAAYPDKPIRVIVPYAAGGTLDQIVRMVGDKFAQSTGQPFVVDNKGGASGIIGMEALAKSDPDGYTIGATSINMLVINPFLFKNLPYDPVKSFEPILQAATTNHSFAVNAAVPASTLKEFLEWTKANPGKVSSATNGAGTVTHLVVVLLNQRMGLDMQAVPYKGSGDAMKDFVGGHVQTIVGTAFQLKPLATSGKAKILAICKSRRSDILPDVPTFAELGYPDLVVDLWEGYLAPAGVPAHVVQKLHAEISRILALPDVAQKIRAYGSDIVAGTPAEFKQMIRNELTRWEGVVKASGWKVQ